MKKEIEILVRAIIQAKGKILVCKKIGKDYYFFPGGHVNYGENATKALARELKEELAIAIKKLTFIGGSEHIFIEDELEHQEINLVFETKVNKLKTKSQENHLSFFLISKNELRKEKVLPAVLTKAVFKWLKDKKPFWASQIHFN